MPSKLALSNRAVAAVRLLCTVLQVLHIIGTLPLVLRMAIRTSPEVEAGNECMTQLEG